MNVIYPFTFTTKGECVNFYLNISRHHKTHTSDSGFGDRRQGWKRKAIAGGAPRALTEILKSVNRYVIALQILYGLFLKTVWYYKAVNCKVRI